MLRTARSNDKRVNSLSSKSLCSFLLLALLLSFANGYSATVSNTKIAPSLVQGINASTHPSSPIKTPMRRRNFSRLNSLPTPPQTSSSSSTSSTSLESTVAVSMPQEVADTNSKSEDYQWTKKNLAIALPALMGLLADPVLSMVDTGFVGRVGPVDLAALGVCTSIFNMAFTVFRASTVATSSLVGSASTKEDKRQIAKISLQLGGVMGTLVLLALRFGGPAALATMGVPSTSPMYNPACEYLFSRSWAAPAVVGIVVAEGAFRGNDDSKTPLVASSVAALINLILDPILMFPIGMGMAGAAAATAVSQLAAAGVYCWRLWKRKLLPQPNDKTTVNTKSVIKSILGANLAMLTKQGSMLLFYTAATALATRMGSAHVATHQIALSLFWLVTYWLDSGSVSAQVLMSKNMGNVDKATSLTKYMLKYGLMQGIAFSAIVAGIGKFIPGVFTSDPTIQSLLFQCLPHLAFQQTLVSLTLILEGLAIGGNQFRYMAAGTTVATAAGLYSMLEATSVTHIWSTAVNVFFGGRFLNGLIGVTRVHLGLRRKRLADQEASAAVFASY